METFGKVDVDETLEQRLAAVRKREHIRKLRKREWAYFAVIIPLVIYAFVNFKRVVVDGHSMEPSYSPGEAVFVWKAVPINSLKPGDVIVFKMGKEELIKRIFFIAKPGDPAPPPGFPATITTPNGALIPPDAPPGLTYYGYFNAVQSGKLPPPSEKNTIYVLGDNVLRSNDSRDFGPISPDQILGKVYP